MGEKKETRGARGAGSVFFSESMSCWVWRAVTGHKPDGTLSYTSGRARTQTEAVRKRRAAEKSNQQPGEDKETVGEHLDHWLNDVAKPNVRGNTWARYEQICRLHLKPNIGGIPLRKLSVATVTKLWASLFRGGMKSGGVKTCSEVLASALEVAVRQGKIATAPTRNAEKPKLVQGVVEVFSDGEMKTIMAAAKGDRLEALFLLAIASGAREGELLALEREDVDLDGAAVRITKMLDYQAGEFKLQPPKSKSGVRTIGIPEFALVSLRAHLVGVKSGPLFTTRSGQYISKSNFVRRDWRDLLAAGSVTYRKFHTIRHTHASRLLAAGVDPAEVARRLGDRIETVMRVYSHWIDVGGRDTAAKVNQIYAGV